MNAGMNVWVNEDGKTVKSDRRPSGGGWYPHYPKSHVHGEKYTPYQGRSEWERAANQSMAEDARSNFQRKQSR